MSFGEHVKKIRSQKGLSMRELERRSGLSQSYISQLEKGIQQNPKSETIQKLAIGLNTDYKDLLKEAGFVDSFFELFNLGKPTLNGFIEEKNGLLTSAKNYDFPINDIFFHLSDKNNKKMYKTIILSDTDREEIRALIENYLIRKLSSGEEDNRELLKLVLDDGFEFPESKKSETKE